MGFARRAVRRSARRAVRRTVTKPVRKAVRTATPRPVRQAMHPAYTARNAVTPRPVKQVTYAVHATRHPFFTAWDAFLGAVFYSSRIRRHKREVLLAAVSRAQTAPPPPAPVRQPAPPARTTPRQTALPQRTARPPAPSPPAAEMIRWRNGPGGLAFRTFRSDLADLTVLWDRVTADRGNTQLWAKLVSVYTRFGADVAAAMSAPAMPDPQAQRAWNQALVICQRAAEDYRIGVETRDRAMIGRGNAHIQIARVAMQELTARIKAITPPRSAAPRPAPVAPQPQRRNIEPWPANRAFRTPPPDVTPPEPSVGPPSSAGEWELDARRWPGLGDGSRNQ
jgi:hypothetical protein